MRRFSDLVSITARDMAGYFPGPGQPDAVAQPSLIKLDSNENPFGPSPLAIEAMQSALSSTNSYPDDDCHALRRKLAAYHELSLDQVLVTAGSTEMLALLCHTLLAPGLNAVTSERSFIVYEMVVHAAGARLIQAPMRKSKEGSNLDDAFDLDAILTAINGHTRLVLLANPNNPTGTMLDSTAIDNFLARVPEHVVVILDEAYFEFARAFSDLRQLDYSRSREFLRRSFNLVVLRTFSKVHGLAGLRVGYGLGPAELLAYCARMQNTYSVSSLAQAAAIAALDDHDYVARVVSNNTSQAQVLTEGLLEMGHRVLPTFANFLYCDVNQEASRIAARLRREGVSVRPLAAWGAPNCIRVTIGTPKQNQLFLNAMRKTAAPI